jgi:hypothetical protein
MPRPVCRARRQRGRQEFAVYFLGAQTKILIRLGEKNQSREIPRSVVLRGIARGRRGRAERHPFRRQPADAEQVLSLHFVLGKIGVARQLLQKITTIDRAMMKIRCGYSASGRQHHRKPGIHIAVIAAQYATQRFALNHFPPGVADAESRLKPSWKLSRPLWRVATSRKDCSGSSRA